MFALSLVLSILALALLALATFNVPSGWFNLFAGGMALWMLSMLVGHL